MMIFVQSFIILFFALICIQCSLAQFHCDLHPKPITNYSCDAHLCITDVFGLNPDPNKSFCCYCNTANVCTKTAKYQHGAPLDGGTVSCEMTVDQKGEGKGEKCKVDTDCNLRWTCKDRLWIQGTDVEHGTKGLKTYDFYEERWPHGLPPVCNESMNKMIM